MLVTLAYPYNGHAPDETIDVAGRTGRQLVRDGVARLAAADVLDGMTVEQLKAYAADHGIDLDGATRKADIADAIHAAERTGIPPSTPITPVPGTNEGDS